MTRKEPIVIGAIVAGAVAALVIASRVKAPPEMEEPEVPFEPLEMVTKEDILAAADFQELDDYYFQIALLYRAHKITFEEYMELYDTYVIRFNQLWEALS